MIRDDVSSDPERRGPFATKNDQWIGFDDAKAIRFFILDVFSKYSFFKLSQVLNDQFVLIQIIFYYHIVI